MDTMTTVRRKGGAGAGALAQRREEAEAKARIERRVKRGARAEKESEAAAESAIVAAPEARTDLDDTEHARVPFVNGPKVGALSRKKKVPSDNPLTI